MNNAVRFPFLDAHPTQPGTGLMPFLPLALEVAGKKIEAAGLLDKGAVVNVLPFSLGNQLGLDWRQPATPIVLTGNLARYPARGIVASVSVAHFNPVRLVFAWTEADSVPLILGQTNFFMEFDVCFFRARSQFELTIKHND